MSDIHKKTRNIFIYGIPIGVSDFKKLIEGKYLFADKSLFIKDIVKDGSEVIVVLPK